MIKAALQNCAVSLFIVEIVGQDHRRGAAVFEGAAGSRRQPGAQHPAHARAADEAEKPDPGVGYQPFRGGDILCHQRLAPARRQTRLAQNSHESEAGQRRIVRRLDDDRATRGHCGGHLVDDQIQRMIKCADRDDNADRLFLGERESRPAGRRGAHRYDAAGIRSQGFDTERDAIDSARDLDLGVAQRLTAFTRREQRQIGLSGTHQRGRAFEDGDSLMQRDPRVAVAKQRVRGVQGSIDMLGIAGFDFGDQGLVVGRP